MLTEFPSTCPTKEKAACGSRRYSHAFISPASTEGIRGGGETPPDQASICTLHKAGGRSTCRPLIKGAEVLDPDRKLEDLWAYSLGPKRKKFPRKLCGSPGQGRAGTCQGGSVSHPAISIIETKSKQKRIHSLICLLMYQKGRKFCKWISTFGDLGIDEQFIMKLCEVGCDCPPTHDKPCMKKVSPGFFQR